MSPSPDVRARDRSLAGSGALGGGALHHGAVLPRLDGGGAARQGRRARDPGDLREEEEARGDHDDHNDSNYDHSATIDTNAGLYRRWWKEHL